MTLHDKSEENIRLVSHCFNSGEYCTAAGGRAYYAVFQRLKHVLKEEKFDYDGFLAGKKENEKPYSHGTISMAFSHHIASTRGMTVGQVAAAIVPFQELYRIRKKADYESGNPVLPLELKRYFELAEQLLKYVDLLTAGRTSP
jgi:hypothetical protein